MAGKKYKTIIWHDPIYEFQENEIERHHHYYKMWDAGTFRSYQEFHDYLLKISSEKWHKYDRNKKNPGPPDPKQISDMALQGKWKLRRQTRINDEERYNRDLKRKLYAENEISEFKQKQSIKSRILNKIDFALDYDEKFSQINQGVQAYTGLKEDDRKDLGISDELNHANKEEDSEENSTIPVIENPDWENPDALKARRDMFWSMIKQRGE